MGSDDRKINIGELFDDDDGIYDEERPIRDAARGPLDVEVSDQGDGGEAVELDTASVALTLSADDYADVQLGIQARIDNLLGEAVEVDSLMVALRDADGRLLDHESVWLNSRFTRSQEVVTEVEFDQAAVDLVRGVDLYASLEYEFQALIATAELDEPALSGREPQRHRWPLRLTNVEPSNPGQPRFDVELSAAVGIRFSDPFAGFVVKLAELTPSSNLNRSIVLAFRDTNEKLLAKETTSLRTAYPGYPTVEKVRFTEISAKALKRAARLDIAARGTVERVVHLGSFKVKG